MRFGRRRRAGARMGLRKGRADSALAYTAFGPPCLIAFGLPSRTLPRNQLHTSAVFPTILLLRGVVALVGSVQSRRSSWPGRAVRSMHVRPQVLIQANFHMLTWALVSQPSTSRHVDSGARFPALSLAPPNRRRQHESPRRQEPNPASKHRLPLPLAPLRQHLPRRHPTD